MDEANFQNDDDEISNKSITIWESVILMEYPITEKESFHGKRPKLEEDNMDEAKIENDDGKTSNEDVAAEENREFAIQMEDPILGEEFG